MYIHKFKHKFQYVRNSFLNGITLYLYENDLDFIKIKRLKDALSSLPGYGMNELSVPRGWTDFLERRDKLLEALPIFIMGWYNLIRSLQNQQSESSF